MVEREIEIMMPGGLHLSTATKLYYAIRDYDGVCKLLKEGCKPQNALGYLGIFSLGIRRGDIITVRCEGKDEQAMLEAACEALESEEEAYDYLKK